MEQDGMILRRDYNDCIVCDETVADTEEVSNTHIKDVIEQFRATHDTAGLPVNIVKLARSAGCNIYTANMLPWSNYVKRGDCVDIIIRKKLDSATQRYIIAINLAQFIFNPNQSDITIIDTPTSLKRVSGLIKFANEILMPEKDFRDFIDNEIGDRAQLTKYEKISIVKALCARYKLSYRYIRNRICNLGYSSMFSHIRMRDVI